MAEVHQSTMWFGSMLDWSPDRKFLAVPDATSPQGSPGIFLVSLEDGQKSRLTSPSAEHLGDSSPRFSPTARPWPSFEVRVVLPTTFIWCPWPEANPGV